MPIKRIHLYESQLNELYNKHYFEGGTDHPYFYDEESGEEYTADWNGDYGFPFGYWPVVYGDYDSLDFSLGDAWTTHENACGKCANLFFNDAIECNIRDAANEISEALNSLYSMIKENGYTYNEEDDVYVSSDGSDMMDVYDFVSQVRDELYDSYDMSERLNLNAIVEDMLGGSECPSAEDIEHMLMEGLDNYDFSSRGGIDEALETIGLSFDEYFENGCLMGRIWPSNEMIGFYESQQPEPREFMGILRELSNCSEIGLSVDDMLKFHIVFYDPRNDGTVTASTVQEYIDGTYGDNDGEDEEEVHYNNGEKAVFVPHLANQRDKREFFKDFRTTRDNAVYAPRERGGGGTLASYHAMRYPYGENNSREGKDLIGETDRHREG